MKKIFYILIIIPLIAGGCIRHSDQPIKRKAKRNNLEEVSRGNIKRMSFVLMVNNIEQTTEFYRDILNFEVVATSQGDNGKNSFAIIASDNYEIILQEKVNMINRYPYFNYKDIGGTASLFFEVNNLMDIYNSAKNKTQLISDLNQTFHGTKEFAILDNNGYVIIFSELLK